MKALLDQIRHNLNLSGGSTLGDWVTAFSLVLASLLLYFIISRIFKRIGKNSTDNLFRIAWQKFRYPVLALILLIDFIILQGIFPPGEEFAVLFGHFIALALIFVLTWFLIRLINLAREVIMRRYDISERDNLQARKVFTQFRILERIIIFIVVLIAIAIALMTFDSIRRIGVSLFASAGVVGIIVGFAAQKVIASVLGMALGVGILALVGIAGRYLPDK